MRVLYLSLRTSDIINHTPLHNLLDEMEVITPDRDVKARVSSVILLVGVQAAYVEQVLADGDVALERSKME